MRGALRRNLLSDPRPAPVPGLDIVPAKRVISYMNNTEDSDNTAEQCFPVVIFPVRAVIPVNQNSFGTSGSKVDVIGGGGKCKITQTFDKSFWPITVLTCVPWRTYYCTSGDPEVSQNVQQTAQTHLQNAGCFC